MRLLPRSRRGTWLLAGAALVAMVFVSSAPRDHNHPKSELLVGRWNCEPAQWYEFREDGTFTHRSESVEDHEMHFLSGYWKVHDDHDLILSANDSHGQMQQLRFTIAYVERDYFCLELGRHFRFYRGIPPRKSQAWFAAGAALLALPIALLAWRRTRRLRAA